MQPEGYINDTDALIDGVVRWGRDKELNDPIMQFAKMIEENGEIAHELTRATKASGELKDALGDSAVTLTILADILGYDIRECLEAAYIVIKKRTGKTINGSFVKDV